MDKIINDSKKRIDRYLVLLLEYMEKRRASLVKDGIDHIKTRNTLSSEDEEALRREFFKKLNTEKIEIDEEELPDEILEVLSEVLSDMISSKTGFCHKGFTFKIQIEAELDKSE